MIVINSFVSLPWAAYIGISWIIPLIFVLEGQKHTQKLCIIFLVTVLAEIGNLQNPNGVNISLIRYSTDWGSLGNNRDEIIEMEAISSLSSTFLVLVVFLHHISVHHATLWFHKKAVSNYGKSFCIILPETFVNKIPENISTLLSFHEPGLSRASFITTPLKLNTNKFVTSTAPTFSCI